LIPLEETKQVIPRNLLEELGRQQLNHKEKVETKQQKAQKNQLPLK